MLSAHRLRDQAVLSTAVQLGLFGAPRYDAPPHTPFRASSFLPTFEVEFAPLLGARAADGLRAIISLLEDRAVHDGAASTAPSAAAPFSIVETSVTSSRHDRRVFTHQVRLVLCADGGRPAHLRPLSSLTLSKATTLWDRLATHHASVHGVHSEVHSVDPDVARCTASKRLVSNRTSITTGDPVAFLWNFPGVTARPVSLLCLNSQDSGSPANAAAHRLKELAAALGAGLITRGHTLIIADGDGPADPTDEIGELTPPASPRAAAAPGNALVSDFMRDVGCRTVLDGWQAGWVC